MARTTITLSDEVLKRLQDYIDRKYGERRVLSMVIEKAIKEFLEKERR
jgi:metal-responsive CopG/Arc/MetJ family transcriptional regulator